MLERVLKAFDRLGSYLNPNWVSSVRPVIGIVILYLLCNLSLVSIVSCLVLLSISEFTDFLDGWLARRYNKTSDWGKLYDPFCDAFSHLLMYIGFLLSYPGQTFAIVIGIILFREMYMMLLRAWCAHNGVILAAQIYGKIKTVTQVVSIYALTILVFAVLAGMPLEVVNWLKWLAISAVGVALAMTVISLYMYQLHIHNKIENGGE